MRLAIWLTVLALLLSAVPSFAGNPLEPGFKVGEQLGHNVCEYQITGPDAGKKVSLICKFGRRPVVMVFARQINAPVTRLIKRLDTVTGSHVDAPLPARLGSYLVLLSERDSREADLKALAEKEKIQHTLLSLLYDPGRLSPPDDEGLKRVLAKVGPEAEVTVVLASDLKVKASFAYREGELSDKGIDQILAGLSKVLPKKE